MWIHKVWRVNVWYFLCNICLLITFIGKKKKKVLCRKVSVKECKSPKAQHLVFDLLKHISLKWNCKQLLWALPIYKRLTWNGLCYIVDTFFVILIIEKNKSRIGTTNVRERGRYKKNGSHKCKNLFFWEKRCKIYFISK